MTHTQKSGAGLLKGFVWLLFAAAVVLIPGEVLAQKISINVASKPLSEVFRQIKQASGYQVFYANQNVDDRRVVTFRATNADLRDVLDRLCEAAGLSYRIVDHTIVVSVARNAAQASAPAATPSPAPRFTVSGYVLDDNKRPVPYASVVQKGATHNGVSTDE